MTTYRKPSRYRSAVSYRGVADLPPVIRYQHVTAGLPWTSAAKAHASAGIPWRTAERLRADRALAWSHAPHLTRAARVPWMRVTGHRLESSLPWDHPPAVQRETRIRWSTPPRLSVRRALPWGRPPSRHVGVDIAWRSPPGRSVEVGLPWSRPPSMHHSASLPAQHPPLRFRRWLLPWGHAPAIQWHVGSPGVHPPPYVPPGGYVPPRGDQVAISFLCPQLVFPGDQVPVPFGPAACYFAWPKPKVYVVENSAFVVRLPERTPVSVTSIDLSQSVDDVFWSMRMALGDPAALELLKPDAGGPKVVEITLNGYVWTAIVESWQQDRQHPSRTVNVSGRSQCALLDAPYAPLRSKVQATDQLIEQLIDAELDLTDFTADYSAVAYNTGIGGWTVPAGVFAYDAQSPIAAIRTLAAASGAVVQSHPWDLELIITPRYPVSPWDWPTTAPDKQIQDDIILTDTMQVASKPLYDYVLVSGEHAGVSDPIIRDGTAGMERAQMVVDALITDHLASRERGRNVLADRGEQATGTVTIPLFPATVAGQPGLVLPLQLVEVIEPVSWKAIATAVSITAARQDQGSASVLVVQQTVSLERHYTDAG